MWAFHRHSACHFKTMHLVSRKPWYVSNFPCCKQSVYNSHGWSIHFIILPLSSLSFSQSLSLPTTPSPLCACVHVLNLVNATSCVEPIYHTFYHAFDGVDCCYNISIQWPNLITREKNTIIFSSTHIQQWMPGPDLPTGRSADKIHILTRIISMNRTQWSIALARSHYYCRYWCIHGRTDRYALSSYQKMEAHWHPSKTAIFGKMFYCCRFSCLPFNLVRNATNEPYSFARKIIAHGRNARCVDICKHDISSCRFSWLFWLYAPLDWARKQQIRGGENRSWTVRWSKEWLAECVLRSKEKKWNWRRVPNGLKLWKTLLLFHVLAIHVCICNMYIVCIERLTCLWTAKFSSHARNVWIRARQTDILTLRIGEIKTKLFTTFWVAFFCFISCEGERAARSHRKTNVVATNLRRLLVLTQTH